MPAEPTSACHSCPAYSPSALRRLGVDISNADYVVALAGNPNTGKSTVFNALTGLRQHVGNWPGKTVARAEGGFTYNDKTYKLIDLPGTYSLLSTSVDEEIARDFILFGRPDVTIVLVDATRLERNLNLALQILEITDRAVIALNLIDEAGRHGITVDDRHLARKLGVPVVPMAARRGQGVPELLQAVAAVATRSYVAHPHRIRQRDAQLEQAIQQLVVGLERDFPDLPNARWVALRLLDGDAAIEEAVRSGTLGAQLRVTAPQTAAEVIPLEAVTA